MKEYNYTDVIKIADSSIQFNDGYILKLEECKKNWAIKRGNSIKDNLCVASRNITESIPYFLFYLSNEDKIKIYFKYKGFLKRRRAEKSFLLFQIQLNNIGYTTYDES